MAKTRVVLETTLQEVILESPGPQGPQGPPGANSSDPFYYLHTEVAPTTSWTVTHNLGAFPNVQVLVGGLTVSGARIDHVDTNSLIVTFNTPQSGKVVCS